jgi:hypothetical protein
MSTRFLAMAACCLLAVPALAQEHKVRQIKIQPDKAPDCSTLKSIVDSVTKDCKTNDEKAIALYNFMLLTHYHQGYPGEKGGLGALKEINVYGWSLCGGLHTVEAALWKEAGYKWRYVGWSNPGHTTVEVEYDGKWHYLDVFLRYWTWMPDPTAPGGRTVAGEMDIKANPALVTDGLEFDKSRGVWYHKGNKFENVGDKANWTAPSFLNCGDDPPGIITGIKSSNRSGSPEGWAGLQFDSPGYTTDVNLVPGQSLTLTWDPIPGDSWWNGRKYIPGHGCADKDYRNCPVIGPIMEPYNRTGGLKRSWANGTLVAAPDLSSEAALADLAAKDNVQFAAGKLVPADASKPASITVALSSPYIMSRANGSADGVTKTEISVDGGKSFKACDLKDLSEIVGGEYAALVRLTFKESLSNVRLEAIVQCNRGSLPYLSPGKNKITVAVADPKDLGDNQLVVTYAFEPGFRMKSYEDLADQGAELGRAHNASWAKTPTVVQKTFAAKDLPATFDIDLPTPAGKYPVYPRMLFVRREIVAPGSKSLPLPEGATAPVAAKADELKTLPNPFTITLGTAPKKVERQKTTRMIQLQNSQTVSIDGMVEPNHHLAWKKGNTWVMLIGGDLQDLPASKDIAAAKLVFPVTRGHEKAAVKVGVSLLTAPIEAGKALDYKKLGDVASFAVVPKQPSASDYSPPKEIEVDVTRAVKQIAAGEAKFQGLALRVIQDRSIDEGYLTRVDLAAGARPYLMLEVYEKQ